MNGNQVNTQLLYRPASLDFSKVGDNLEQITRQYMSYQREKKQREKARKDMMWQRYLKLYNTPPPQATNVNNQQILDKMYSSLLGELDSIADKLDDDENDVEALQQGKRKINQYKAGVNKVHAWEQQYQKDRTIAYQNIDKITPESRESILNYRGGKPYDGFIKFQPKDPNQAFMQLGNQIEKSNPFAVAEEIHKNTAGELLAMKKTVQGGENPFWKQDPNTGQWVPTEKQKQAIENKVVSEPLLAQGLIEEMGKVGKIVDKEKGIYKVRGKLYSVDPTNKKLTEDDEQVGSLSDFAYDFHGNQAFRKIKTEATETTVPAPEEPEKPTQAELKATHKISQGQRIETFGKEKFPNYVGLGQRNLSGTASFDKVKDPLTGETVNIGDEEGKGKTRDYQIIGIDPYEKKMLIALEGSDLKRTPSGKKLTNTMKGMRKSGIEMGMLAAPDITQPKMFVVDANRYRNLLEQEVFIDRETNQLIFGGGPGIRPEPEDTGQQEQETDPLGILD